MLVSNKSLLGWIWKNWPEVRKELLTQKTTMAVLEAIKGGMVADRRFLRDKTGSVRGLEFHQAGPLLTSPPGGHWLATSTS